MPRDSRRGAGRRGAVAGIRSQPRPPGAAGVSTRPRDSAVRIWVLGAVAAADRLKRGAVAIRARGHGLLRLHGQLLATVRALVRARRYVASGWDWLCHRDLLRSFGPPYPAGPRQNSRVADVDALEGGEQPVHDLDVLLRHRPRSIPREGGEEKDGGWVRTPTKARVTIAAMLERLFASRPKRNLLAGASCSKLRRGLGGWAARSLSPSRLNEHPADRD